MRVLVFDTETTGLPEPGNPSIYQTERWPYILQLSYIVYDTTTNELVAVIDRLVCPPSDIVISPESTAVHNITPLMCRLHGKPIREVLTEFNIWHARCDRIVGHNVSFDKRILIVECIRNNVKGFTLSNPHVGFYCTMRNGVDKCQIPALSKKVTHILNILN